MQIINKIFKPDQGILRSAQNISAGHPTMALKLELPAVQSRLFENLLASVIESKSWKAPATCACIMAVDVGIPTKIAHLLLEYFVSKGSLAKVDLRQLARWRSDLRRSLSDQEFIAIESHPGELNIYFKLEESSRTADLFQPLVIELALMLRIFRTLLISNLARLKWNFQVSVKVLRIVHSYPVGALANEYFDVEGASWSEAHRNGRIKFEDFEVNTSTQLRILLHLALWNGGGEIDKPRPATLGELHRSTARWREAITSRFGRLLVDGLEVPADHRSNYCRQILPGESLVPSESDLWPAATEWYRFLDYKKNEMRASDWRKLIAATVNELPPLDWRSLPHSVQEELDSNYQSLQNFRQESFLRHMGVL